MAPLGRKINIPNTLTFLRFLLVPVFLFLVINDRLHFATFVFILAGLTDALDGYIARNFRQRTDLGAIMDPLADKALLVTALISLAAKGYLFIWFCVLAVARDIIMVLTVLALKRAGKKVVISPTIYGKLTTVFQITTIIYATAFSKGLDDKILLTLAGVTIALTLFAGFDYARREFLAQKGA